MKPNIELLSILIKSNIELLSILIKSHYLSLFFGSKITRLSNYIYQSVDLNVQRTHISNILKPNYSICVRFICQLSQA